MPVRAFVFDLQKSYIRLSAKWPTGLVPSSLVSQDSEAGLGLGGLFYRLGFEGLGLLAIPSSSYTDRELGMPMPKISMKGLQAGT